MAKVPVDRADRPVSDITIARCGELDPQNRPLQPAEVARQVERPVHKNPNHDDCSCHHCRGRETAKRSSTPSSLSRSLSDSRSRSRSPHVGSDQRRHHHQHHHHHHHHKKPRTRRRSDVAIDETRRGRSLTRSPSPEIRSSQTWTRPRHQHYHPPPLHGSHRKRSPSPSRPSLRPRSRSPHLRRRRTRSRSRRDRDRDRDRDWRGDKSSPRRRDEEALREVEEEREGGRARWQGATEGVDRYRGRDTYQGSKYRTNRGGRDLGEVRGGEGEGVGEPVVQFKGRGSMKYRERQ